MASDIYFTIENGRLVHNIENDGWAYVRRGAERESTYISLETARKMNKGEQALQAIKEYEEKTGLKFEEK